MRAILRDGPVIRVTDDPDGVIGEFLEYALSAHALSRRERARLADDLAERFAPDGGGLTVPDLFVAYQAAEPDDLPPNLVEEARGELGRAELWVLTRLRFRGRPEASAVVEGDEVRRLLGEML
ncbi:hypothetical protein ABT340_20630 [Streptosporangium sp. NPDC000239]|uniref:hypothetical protein n=1 Tax=Streptosporangium sp. NPDC000239 TaxID=3154248 RepID=UPI00333463D9